MIFIIDIQVFSDYVLRMQSSEKIMRLCYEKSDCCHYERSEQTSFLCA